ncbi:MAG: flagellar basal body P-ring formation protein FlgA [Candidatus Kuenenia sp.]|nr:flagellar basal body P-ring formation protein FlgA [Candidatus Kuenenia hertensis]
MKTKFLLIIPFLMLTTISITFGEQITIELKDSVTLPEKEVTLGDIAYISCNDSDLLQKLNNVYIGNTPWPGNVRKIEKNIITSRLLDAGIDPNEVSYGKNDFSMISVESITITGDEILQTAKDYVTSNLSFSERNEEIVVEADRPPNDAMLPFGGGNIRMEVSQVNANKSRGRVQVVVRIYVGDKQYQKIPMYFNIRHYEDIVVASKRINRNDILTAKDLYIKRVETTRMPGITTFDNMKPLLGKRVLYTILPDKPLTQNMIDEPAAIKKGELVKILVKIGNLSVITKGIAKEDGYKGRVIKIMNLDTKRELYGEVKDDYTVKVIL